MKHHILAAILVGAFALQTGTVSAASICGTVSVAALIGTTCSLGDKEFTFTSYNGFGSTEDGTNIALDPTQIAFTPDGSHPYDLSFTLSSLEFSSASTNTTDGRMQFGELYFSITEAPGSPYLASYDVTVNGGTAMSGPETPGHAPASWAAGNLALFGLECTAVNMVGSNTDGPILRNDTCGNVPTTSQSGYAFWGLSAGGGPASASMTSVTYAFRQSDAQPVPEPSSLVLLSCSLVGIAAVRRWRLKGI